jgi:hypothetical protein
MGGELLFVSPFIVVGLIDGAIIGIMIVYIWLTGQKIEPRSPNYEGA